jgi:purine-binding chemotaxis protein CheW
LHLEAVAEIVPMAALSTPPNRPILIEGFLNLAGSAIPVIRLERLFGLPVREVELYTPLLVVRTQAGPLALWVERVTGVCAVSESAPLTIEPGHSFNGCVEALLGTPEQRIHLLAVERLLLEKERQCVAGFQEQEQRRWHELEAGRA